MDHGMSLTFCNVGHVFSLPTQLTFYKKQDKISCHMLPQYKHREQQGISLGCFSWHFQLSLPVQIRDTPHKSVFKSSYSMQWE